MVSSLHRYILVVLAIHVIAGSRQVKVADCLPDDPGKVSLVLYITSPNKRILELLDLGASVIKSRNYEEGLAFA